MNNQQFKKALAFDTGLSTFEITGLQEACINAMLKEVVQGNIVSLPGLGEFELKTKASRKMYNPQTKEYSIVPERYSLGFKVNKTLKEQIKG